VFAYLTEKEGFPRSRAAHLRYNAAKELRAPFLAQAALITKRDLADLRVAARCDA